MLKILLSFSILLLFSGCNFFSRNPASQSAVSRVIEQKFPSGKDVYGNAPNDYVALGKKGAVSSEGVPPSQIALDILKRGGNAVDAAIALSFAVSVHRPQSTGIGGGGFLLIHKQKEKSTTVVDMRERAPAKASRDMYLENGKAIAEKSRWGALAVAVPGLVAGLYEIYQKEASGKFTWAELVAPSVDLARNGFLVDPHLAQAIEVIKKRELLGKFPRAQRLLTRKDGTPLKSGDLYKNEPLAKTLEEIAKKGRKGFYEGWVAKEIVKTIQSEGGILSLKDLKDYRVKYPKPVTGTFGPYQVHSMPPPSSGGVHIIQMLNMLSHAGVSRDFQDVEGLHKKAEIMRRAFADRSRFLGDPAFFSVPVKGLIDRSYARALASEINPKQASASAEVKPGKPDALEKRHTTHFSIVDSNGMAVSSTQTINLYFGAILVGGKTGVFLNDEMDDFSAKPGVQNAFGLVGGEANAIAPGKTPLSSMTPTIVTKDGKLFLILGSPGGSKIITSVWNVLVNVVHHEMSLRDAVFAPRIHHQWIPDKLVMEVNGFDRTTAVQMRARGHEIKQDTDFDVGNVSAIHIDPKTGQKTAVADLRRGGSAMAY